jgi:hypothetical protein
MNAGTCLDMQKGAPREQPGPPGGELGTWGGRKTHVFPFTRRIKSILPELHAQRTITTHMLLFCALTTANSVDLPERANSANAELPIIIHHTRDLCQLRDHESPGP